MCSKLLPTTIVLLVLLRAASAGGEPSTLAPEYGYAYGEHEPPRVAAMGGALRALGNSTEAVFTNPAGLASTRVYHIAAIGELMPQAARQSYGAAVVDSVVNRQGIAAGVSGIWGRQDPDGLKRQSSDFRVAVAAPLGEKFFVGGAARYLRLSQDGYPRNGGALRPSVAASGLKGDDIVDEVTFDAGITIRPVPEFSFALVGTNLTDPGHGFLPLTLGGGAGVGTDDFSLEADVVADTGTYDETTVRAMVGGELLLENVPLRAGYRFDEGLDVHAVSGGIGYLTKEFSLDGAVRVAVSGPTSVMVTLGLKYHLDGAGVVRP